MHDVVVVGGGPAGCKAAIGLARHSDVLVLEEHGSSGLPMQCAGLVTDDVIRMSGVTPDILNTLSGAEVVFPDGLSVPIRSRKPIAMAIDRTDLDSKLADAALSAGADISYSEKYFGHTIHEGVEIDTDRGSHRCRAIVGADGHSSAVSMSLGNNVPREYLRGIQADVRTGSDDSDVFRMHLGSEFAPGFFTWEIPCGDHTRVGLCTSWSAGPPIGYLRHLLRHMGCEDRVERMYSGKIPIGGRPRTYGERCLLIGDAAGQVKPVSAGGLYPAFMSAPHLVDTMVSALTDDDLSERRLSRYESLWKADIGKDLDRGYRLRRMFLRLDDRDLDRAGRYASKESVRGILNDIDLDHPGDVVSKIIRKPSVALSAIPLLLRCII